MKTRTKIAIAGLGFVAMACGGEVSGPAGLVPTLGIVGWTDPPAGFVESVEADPGDWGEGNWGNRPPLVAPVAVAAGDPFTVIATTTLPNGCWHPGDYSKEVAGNVAEITVHDFRTDSEMCTAVFGWMSRDIELQFNQPGEAVIRLVGKRIAGRDFGGGEEFIIEHSVAVH